MTALVQWAWPLSWCRRGFSPSVLPVTIGDANKDEMLL